VWTATARLSMPLNDRGISVYLTMYILYMIFICIYHPSLWTFTCFGGAPCLIVYAPESHTLSNYRVRLVSGKKKTWSISHLDSIGWLCTVSTFKDDTYGKYVSSHIITNSDSHRGLGPRSKCEIDHVSFSYQFTQPGSELCRGDPSPRFLWVTLMSWKLTWNVLKST
jgi:hypothetical protein